jgi:pimeloyl-ACP methyl ester carboxylesterase
MTVVFVHGVPETASLWDPVRQRLDRESVALSLPGFGAARPDGFGATMDEYVAWVLGELDQLEGPIDLVGHDWGGIITSRIATTVGDRLHSWVTDAIGTLDPAFQWHAAAKIWQTPGEGEAFWESVRAAPAESATLFAAMGVPEADSVAMIGAVDETMSAAILDLYRSATDIGTEWEAHDKVPSPGLVLLGADDPFGNEPFSRTIAERLGAEVAVLPGAGHFWPLQAPDAGAAELTAFWSRLTPG